MSQDKLETIDHHLYVEAKGLARELWLGIHQRNKIRTIKDVRTIHNLSLWWAKLIVEAAIAEFYAERYYAVLRLTKEDQKP